MRNVEMLKESAFISPNFNVSDYSRMALQMFEDNVEERVVMLKAENKYMLNIIDRFGEDVETEISDDEHFTANVTVRPSATFFAWVFQFRGGIQISEPTDIADSYKEMLQQALL